MNRHKVWPRSRSKLKSVFFVFIALCQLQTGLVLIRKIPQSGVLQSNMADHAATSNLHMASKLLRLPPDFLTELPLGLLDQLFEKAEALNRTRLLLLDPQFGLGNRLRALASSMSFADKTQRMLIVIWQRDSHMGAALEDLIAGYPDIVLSWQNFQPRKPLERAIPDLRVYDFMEPDNSGGRMEPRLDAQSDDHIYLKTAFVLQSPLARDPSVYLKKLTPLPSIEDAAKLDKSFDSVVAVHIRGMTLEQETHVNPIQGYPARKREYLEGWRKVTGNVTKFATEMDNILQHNKDFSFFVISDRYDIVCEIQRLFPGKVLTVDSCCSSRDMACIKCAFLSMLIAAKARAFLGSKGSSYSESIMLLGKGTHLFTRLAGVDF